MQSAMAAGECVESIAFVVLASLGTEEFSGNFKRNKLISVKRKLYKILVF